MPSIKIAQTCDGSNTLFSEQFNAYYHSTNGALQESRHIFIKNGFDLFDQDEINILEIGFGTGLNAALTASSASKKRSKVDYTGIELFPPDNETLLRMNYGDILEDDESVLWEKIVMAPWDMKFRINDHFHLQKIHTDFISVNLENQYNLIYFDAFAPNDQPEMWSSLNFAKLYHATAPNGVLVTYCSKGIVKQALRDAGYLVQRLPGPPKKRHILKANKG